jgi:hypothetical protein
MAQVITIADDALNITVVVDGHKTNFPKIGLNVRATSDSNIVLTNGVLQASLIYANITSPASVNLEALRVALDKMIQPQYYTTGAAYEASAIPKNAAGSFYGFTGFNSGPAQWIMVFDSATLPVDGTAPKIAPVYAPTNSNFSFNWGQYPIAFANGVVICNSTTGPTKTLGAANCLYTVGYT